MLATTVASTQKRRSQKTAATDMCPPVSTGCCAIWATVGSFMSRRRTIANHSTTQTTPMLPTTRKGVRQESFHSRRAMTMIGVVMAPRAAPLCKMLLPNVRCSGGKIRCVVRKAHGQWPDSISPSRNRHKNSISSVRTKPVAKPASDQANTAVG